MKLSEKIKQLQQEFVLDEYVSEEDYAIDDMFTRCIEHAESMEARLEEKEKQWRYEKERRDAAEILCGEYSNNFAPITDDGEDYVKWHEANDLWQSLVSQEQEIYKTKTDENNQEIHKG